MKSRKTNINTYIVQLVSTLLLGAVSLVYAYPAPALAFSDQIRSSSMKLGYGIPMEVLATAYSSSPGETDSSPFITASGTRVRYGIIAANFLPIGTRVLIDGKEFTVEDRMSERFNGINIIDIWMPTQEDAIAFGTQRISISVRLPRDNK